MLVLFVLGSGYLIKLVSIPKDIDTQLAEVKMRLFPESYTNAPDVDRKFPTNGDRFAASEVNKRMDTEGFTKKGFMLQAIAAGWHHKSAAQLKQIGDSVGRERILVLHGTYDRMITVPHGITLIEELGGEGSGLTGKIYPECGHVLPMEKREEFSKVITDLVNRTTAL